MKRAKLELTWINKEVRPRLEPRILLEDPTLTYHAPHRVSEKMENLPMMKADARETRETTPKGRKAKQIAAGDKEATLFD